MSCTLRHRVDFRLRARASQRAHTSRCISMHCSAQQATSAPPQFLDVASKTAIPRLGLGLAALGRPGYINIGHDQDLSSKSPEDMRQQCWRVLDEAHALGIRYFDAARSYGKAEDFLGTWLAARGHAKAPSGPASVVIGSKWGYIYTADWQVDTGGRPHEVKEHNAPNLRRQAEETQANLGQHLHLYQIHSATLDSGVLDNGDVLALLEKLKVERGWKLGFSCSGVQQAETIRAALTKRMADGRLLFDSVQATWNVMEQSAGDALKEAHDSGLSVIVKEGMANGRLLQGEALAAMQGLASQYDTTPDALALAVAMVQPFQPMVLSGAATVAHLRSNAAAVKVAETLNPDDVRGLLQTLRQDPGRYWSERSSLAWN